MATRDDQQSLAKRSHDGAARYRDRVTAQPSTKRELPFDLEVEKAVLGAIVLAPEVLASVRAVIGPPSFYHPAHAVIFEAMCAVVDSKEPLDALTLQARLREMRRLNAVGGLQYVSELAECTPTIAHVEQHAQTVRRLAYCRDVIARSERIAESAASVDIAAVDREIEEMRRGAVLISGTKDKPKALSDAIAGVFERFVGRMEEISSGSGPIAPGLTWQLAELHERLPAGSMRGELVVIAAHTSVGKTAFAIQHAVHVANTHALDPSEIVVIFSLEMLVESLALRVVAALASKAVVNGVQVDVPQHAILSGYVTSEQYDAIAHVMRTIDLSRYEKIQVIDKFGIDFRSIENHLRSFKARGKKPVAVFIDYLQQMASDADDTVSSLASLTKKSKCLAGDHETVVYLLSQLSRGKGDGKTKDGKPRKPELQDLHGSSTIEKDADGVVFIHREDKRSPNATIIVAKWRNSDLFEVECRFHGAANEFLDAERTEPDGAFY